MRKYKNILVYALVNLGDVVLTTAATTLLRRAYPDATITMMVKPVVKDAVIGSPVIDEVITFEYRARENSLGAMLRMVKELRLRHFDLAVSYDRKLRPALLAFFAGIPERIGPSCVFEDKPSRVPWLYTRTVPIVHDLDSTLQAETYMAIARGVTGETGTAAPAIAPPQEDDEKTAKALLAQLPAAEKIIALCVKGTFPLKTWPKEYFCVAVRRLAESYNAAFFVVGAPGDRSYSDEVIAEMAPVCVLNFCGKTTLRSLAALLSRVDLFFTVDTGAAHIAATTGVPMVVLYGCTSPKRWHPINKNACVLTSGEPCCPCHYAADACPSAPKPDCLWHVMPDQAVKACGEMLSSAARPRDADGRR